MSTCSGLTSRPLQHAVTCGLLALAAPVAADAGWGSRPYEQERPEYVALIAGLDRRHNDLADRRRAAEAALQRFVDGQSARQRDRLQQQYRRSDSHRNQSELLRRAREREEAARHLYEDHRALRPDERRPEVRARYWAKHVEWMRARNALVEREIAALEAQLVVIQAEATSTWDEFWKENFDDIAYVFREVVLALVGDVYQCFEEKLLDGLSFVLGSAPAGLVDPSFSPQNLWAQGPITLGDVVDVKACIQGPLLKTLVNALSISLKKQFIDAQRDDNRVLPEVAAWWWDEIVAAKPPDQGFLQRVQQRMLSRTTLENAVKQHVDETAIRLYAQDEMELLERRYTEVLKTNRNPEAVRRTMRGIARERAEERFKSKANPVQQVAQGVALGIDIFAEVYKLYENSGVFQQIERNEVARYRKVVACLSSRGEPATAPAVIAVLRADASRFAAWLRDCETQKAEDAADQTARFADLEPILRQLQALLADAESRVRAAEAGCAASRGDIGALGGRLDATKARLQAIDAALRAVAPATAGPDPAEAQRLAAAAYAAAARVLEARQRAEDARDRACRAAVAAATARTPEDHAREVAAAAAAAGDARARDAAAQDAAGQAAAASLQLRSLSAPPAPAAADHGSELAAVQRELEAIESELAVHERTLASAADARSALDRAKASAASLYADAQRHPGAGSGGADTPALMRQIDAAFGRLQSLGGALPACLAELPGAVDGVRTDLAAARATATDIDSRLRGPGTAAELPAEVTRAQVEARASADTAEIYAEATAPLAADAEACSQQAAAVPAPVAPPVSAPSATPGPASTSGGWAAAGPVTTLSEPDPTGPASSPASGAAPTGADASGAATPASGPPLQPGVPGFGRIDVSGLLAGIRAAKDACNMAQAMALAAQVEALDPGNPWVEANRGLLQRMAQGQAAALGHLQQGHAALQANDLAAAGQAASQAAAVAPSCMRPDIERLVAVVNSALRTADAQRAQDRRRTASGILSGLIGIARVVGAARGGQPGTPGLAGVLDDPCTFQFGPTPPGSPHPTCACAGYTFQGLGCFRSGAGAGGLPGGAGGAPAGPVAVDTRTTTCGATSRSGADAPASITVDMGGLGGTAAFSYSMFGVKDRMIVRQGGRTLVDTGCVSGSGSVGLSIVPMGGAVTVIVQPACEKPGTQWNFTLGCPR